MFSHGGYPINGRLFKRITYQNHTTLLLAHHYYRHRAWYGHRWHYYLIAAVKGSIRGNSFRSAALR